MGRGDLTVPVVESWTILSMAAGADGAGDRRAVRDERHEPPPGGRRADGVDAPDRERRTAGASASASAARPRSTRPTASTSPPAARAGRAARGGGRGHPRAVDRRSGDARFAVLPAARRLRLPGARATTADHRRRRDASRGAAGRRGSATAGRPSTTTSSRTCRSISSRSRRRGRRRSDQRVIVGFQGEWLTTSRSRTRRG